MSKIIDNVADCTINQLMQCLFNGKYQVLVIDGEFTDEECEIAFKAIYLEFIDLSKLSNSAEYDLSQSIYYLQGRIQHTDMLISLERESIELTGFPFMPAFGSFKKYGYNLEWNENKERFLKELSNIEIKENRFKIQLSEKKIELSKLKGDRDSNSDTSPYEKRKSFIKSLINLQKAGYKIERDKTTVEEFALMICEQNENGNTNKN